MRKQLFSDNLLIGCFYFVLSVFGIVCLLPFIMLISSSLTDEVTLIQNGYNLLPKKLSLEAYKAIFSTETIYRAYLISVIVTVIGTVLSMIITCAKSYALSSKKLKYSGIISFFIYFTVLFGGGLVPYYLLIAKYLHMKDSIWALIIPGIFSPWYVFMLKNFFKTIPDSLSESARIDGANDIYILIKIILPVSLPAVSTIALFYSIGFWNEWFRAVLFIEKPEYYPLQYIIMAIIRNLDFATSVLNRSNQGVSTAVPAFSARMATTVVTIGPIILLYPFLQKYFVKGLVMGSVKE